MSWCKAWWWASSGSTSRGAESLEGLSALARTHDLPRARHAVRIGTDQPGHVDRRASVEEQGGQAPRILTPVTQQVLDARGIRRGRCAREPGHVGYREAVVGGIDLPHLHAAGSHFPHIRDTLRRNLVHAHAPMDHERMLGPEPRPG